MCEMCDGKTLGEVLLEMHLRIADQGWDLVCVEGDPPQYPPWAYTVGLCDGFEHPELVVTGARLETAAAILDVLAGMVDDEAAWYRPGDVVHLGDRTVHLAAVHPGHLRTCLFNGWDRYYRALGHPMPDLRVLQVVLDEDWFCSCHGGGSQLDLSKPPPTSRTNGPPPVARRRHRRGRR